MLFPEVHALVAITSSIFFVYKKIQACISGGGGDGEQLASVCCEPCYKPCHILTTNNLTTGENILLYENIIHRHCYLDDNYGNGNTGHMYPHFKIVY